MRKQIQGVSSNYYINSNKFDLEPLWKPLKRCTSLIERFKLLVDLATFGKIDSCQIYLTQNGQDLALAKSCEKHL